MTISERLQAVLRFEEPDRPPHFEVMFELEYEAFGLRFPDRRLWATCTPAEKARMVEQCMECYARIVDRYQWDALAVFWPWSDPDGVIAAKKVFGDHILIGSDYVRFQGGFGLLVVVIPEGLATLDVFGIGRENLVEQGYSILRQTITVHHREHRGHRGSR